MVTAVGDFPPIISVNSSSRRTSRKYASIVLLDNEHSNFKYDLKPFDPDFQSILSYEVRVVAIS